MCVTHRYSSNKIRYSNTNQVSDSNSQPRHPVFESEYKTHTLRKHLILWSNIKSRIQKYNFTKDKVNE